MKKLSIIMVLFFAMTWATITTYGPYTLPTEHMWDVDTIVAAETLAVIYNVASSQITGAFTFQYMVRNIHGNTKVTLYFSESNDYSFAWYNYTKIDSCVAGDSALVTIEPKVSAQLKIMTNGFGVAGDSIFVWWKINAERK